MVLAQRALSSHSYKKAEASSASPPMSYNRARVSEGSPKHEASATDYTSTETPHDTFPALFCFHQHGSTASSSPPHNLLSFHGHCKCYSPCHPLEYQPWPEYHMLVSYHQHLAPHRCTCKMDLCNMQYTIVYTRCPPFFTTSIECDLLISPLSPLVSGIASQNKMIGITDKANDPLSEAT